MEVPVNCSYTTLKDVADLVENPRNPNGHPDSQIELLGKIIANQGWRSPIVVSKRSGFIVKGHGRYQAALKIGASKVPVDEQDYETEAQEWADLIADNRLSELAEIDKSELKDLLLDLDDGDFDMDLTGFLEEDLADLMSEFTEDGDSKGESNTSLADRFLVPPFSVLNAREGWWQDRKRGWKEIGIESELGREEGLTFSGAAKSFDYYRDINGANVKNEEQGTSLFDPVLCELVYSWFSPVGGTVVDPFAGGSVRGIVAAKLGRKYIGADLRKEQVEANRNQANSILTETEQAEWIEGDSRNIETLCDGVKADMIFTCPPYADLEVYSDDPKDLSTLDYSDFKEAYTEIIASSCKLLKDDRFACVVVGEVRDQKGNYYNFVGDTITAFLKAGLSYYNEAILVTCAGSVPMRAGKPFGISRKLGKTHQNVLVFVKGDGKRATQACGDVEVHIPEAAELLEEVKA